MCTSKVVHHRTDSRQQTADSRQQTADSRQQSDRATDREGHHSRRQKAEGQTDRQTDRPDQQTSRPDQTEGQTDRARLFGIMLYYPKQPTPPRHATPTEGNAHGRKQAPRLTEGKGRPCFPVTEGVFFGRPLLATPFNPPIFSSHLFLLKHA